MNNQLEEQNKVFLSSVCASGIPSFKKKVVSYEPSAFISTQVNQRLQITDPIINNRWGTPATSQTYRPHVYDRHCIPGYFYSGVSR